MSTQLNSIAVLGHRGWVGQKALPGLAAIGCPMTVIVRPGSEVGQLPEGVKAIQVDWEDEEGFIQALKGINIVLSLVGQPGLAAQARLPPILARAGVDLFVPSDFTFQHDQPEAELVPVIHNKAILEQALRDADVPFLRIWQGNFAEFALGTPRLGVDVVKRRMLLTGDIENQRLNLCTREYVAAALAALLSTTPPAALAGRTIGLTELAPTGSEIIDAIQRIGTPSGEVAIAREQESAAVARIHARHPLALMDLNKVLWSRGLHSVGTDVFEVEGYDKAGLQELVVEGRLGQYREVAVPYDLDAYFA